MSFFSQVPKRDLEKIPRRDSEQSNVKLVRRENPPDHESLYHDYRDLISQRPALRVRGVGSRGAQPKRCAPSRRQATNPRLL